MKAVLCKAPGLPETLVYEDVPDPKPGPREVVVEMRAASVNFPDVLVIQGLYQFKPPFPFSPGNELAGVVTEVGSEVKRVQPGDRVAATVLWGAFAEKVVVDEEAVIQLPDHVDDETAAAMLLTYATSIHALADRATLKAGETLLVLGAAGGVGLAAVQLGKAMGARVIAAASSDEKLSIAKAAGADDLVCYATEDLKARVKDLTGGNGADVIYDPVGGPYTEPALRAIAWEGRLLVVGFAAGDIPKIPLNLVLLKGCQIVGVFWGSFVARTPERHRAHVQELFDLLEQNKIEPHVSARYPLSDTAAALEEVRQRRAKGKIVLTL